MEAAGAVLPRSATSFRRQGSSGLVWDDKLTEEINKGKPPPTEPNPTTPSQPTGGVAYRTVKVSSEPDADPPSPKVSACGFCSVFGKPNPSHQRTSKKR